MLIPGRHGGSVTLNLYMNVRYVVLEFNCNSRRGRRDCNQLTCSRVGFGTSSCDSEIDKAVSAELEYSKLRLLVCGIPPGPGPRAYTYNEYTNTYIGYSGRHGEWVSLNLRTCVIHIMLIFTCRRRQRALHLQPANLFTSCFHRYNRANRRWINLYQLEYSELPL